MGITVAQLLGQNDDPPAATAPVAPGRQALTARDGTDTSAAGARGESDDADDSDADSDDDADGDASLSGEDEVDDEATLDEEAALAAADGAVQVCAACCLV